MSRFLGKFPFVLLHLYAVARFIIGSENASQLTAQKVGKPNTSVLHPPLHIMKVDAPMRWKTVELMKVRDCAFSGQKKYPLHSQFFPNTFFLKIIIILESSWYWSNRGSVKCLIEQPSGHVQRGSKPSYCIHCRCKASC